MVLNSLSFCLYINLLISLATLNESLLDRVFLVVSFSSHQFKYSLSLPSGLQSFFAKKTADSLMGNPLYWIWHLSFSLVAFSIFSLYLTFASLINMCLSMFILCGILYTFWTLITISFPMLGKFSTMISSNIFSGLLSFSSGTPMINVFLESYRHGNSIVLAKKQKYRLTEKDRKPRDKPTHLWSPNLWQRR